MIANSPSKKLVQLEAIRGIASIIVILHHYCLAFIPRLMEPYPAGLVHTPFDWMINGEGAVVIFFALSGLVLTRRYFESQTPPLDLVAAAIKRFPRLALPAGLSIVIGFLILRFGTPYYLDAGMLSGSQWLHDFGGAKLHPDFVPTLVSASKQIGYVFFFPQNFSYNSNLWTMRPEFFGSIFAFIYVLVVCFIVKGRSSIKTVFVVMTAIFCLNFPSYLLPFLVGILIAQFGSRLRPLNVTGGAVLVIAGLIFDNTSSYWCCSISAAFILLAGTRCPRLVTALSGRLGRFLGIISFPLYLVHTLVICSVSSFVEVRLIEGGASWMTTDLLVLAVTLSVSFVAALPFVWLERRWVPWLNSATKAFTASCYRSVRA